jgi:hypothetical protein
MVEKKGKQQVEKTDEVKAVLMGLFVVDLKDAWLVEKLVVR